MFAPRFATPFVVLALASCAPSTQFVEDSLGIRLQFSTERGLVSGPDDPPAIACEEPAGRWSIGGSHFVTLCPSSDSPAIDCRPMICSVAADCPDLLFSRITCDDGLCVSPDLSLRDEDVVSFCVQDLPRNDCSDSLAYATSAAVLVGTALERHCDGSGECTGPIRCGE